MGLHALLIPRDLVKVPRQQFFDRFIAAGLEQHPSATREPTPDLRSEYQFVIISAKTGPIWIHHDARCPADVTATARIPGTSDPNEILRWAHYLFAIAHRVDADLFFEDPRATDVLALYGKFDDNHGLHIIGQPPLPWPKSVEQQTAESDLLPTWEEFLTTFTIDRINDEQCDEATKWLTENRSKKLYVLIDSTGGTITPQFYRLVEEAKKATNVTAVAKKAHSAAALLFLAFEHRSITADGEVVLKPQNITMSLKRAMAITAPDLRRYKDEYARYSNLLKALLKKKSRVSDEHIALILDKEAILVFDATNAVAAGLAEKILELAGTAPLHVVKTEPRERQTRLVNKPFVIFPDPR
jgi:ATP-dependent protease ClpP protease subunit